MTHPIKRKGTEEGCCVVHAYVGWYLEPQLPGILWSFGLFGLFGLGIARVCLGRLVLQPREDSTGGAILGASISLLGSDDVLK